MSIIKIAGLIPVLIGIFLIFLSFIPYFPSLCENVGVTFNDVSRFQAQIIGPVLFFPIGIIGVLFGAFVCKEG